jgi:hypothetical protein
MNADYSCYIIMLARQRSGTNALQAVLETHPEVFCTRETFHDKPYGYEHLDEETNYFRFLERYPKEALIRSRSSDEMQETLFVNYLRFLREWGGKKYVVVDIKYNSSHHFDGPWRGLGSEPQLFRLIRNYGLRVLHLKRRKYVRFFI